MPGCGQPTYQDEELERIANANVAPMRPVGMPKEVRVSRKTKRTLWARICGLFE